MTGGSRLSAFGCLGRGFASLRANWGLVWLQWLQALVLWVLTVAGLLLLLSALGFDLATSYAFLVEGEAPPLGDLERQLESFSPALAGALVGAIALWTLGFFVYCWFQAGTYGVLIAADRQAAPGGGRDPRLFSTFSRRDFAGWAGRYLWRYFGIANLFALLATPVLVLAVVWLVLIAVGMERWGMGGALGIGCGGALPLAFLGIVLAIGMWLAMADAAREGSGVWTATRNGLRVLGRRLAASSLLVAVLCCVMGLEVAIVVVAGFLIEQVTADGSAPRIVAVLSLDAVHWVVASVVSVFLSAAAVALVQAELRRDARPALPGAAAA